jgi:hypothetical protein
VYLKIIVKSTVFVAMPQTVFQTPSTNCQTSVMQRSASRAVVSINFDFLPRMIAKNSGKSSDLLK